MTDVIAQIDAEIAKLQQAKTLLSGAAAVVKTGRRGRPKGSKNTVSATTAPATKTATKAATKTAAKTSKRNLSPEGRKAIAEAMKRRWAERRKQPAK